MPYLALDNSINRIITSQEIGESQESYKRYKESRFRCLECNEDLTFVNQSYNKRKKEHFRHLRESNCAADSNGFEFNKDFYTQWFSYYKLEYRKSYWCNKHLEDIIDDSTIMIIRYSLQKLDAIKRIETYALNKRVVWILSLPNRISQLQTYEDTFTHHEGKIYIKFGIKNDLLDISYYNESSSVVYLDTGSNMLLKIIFNNYHPMFGQEVECVCICDFYMEHQELFVACPSRESDEFFEDLVKEQKEYQDVLLKYEFEYEVYEQKLLQYYNSINKRFKKSKKLEDLYKLCAIYDKLRKPRKIPFNKDYYEQYQDILQTRNKIHDTYSDIRYAKRTINMYNSYAKVQKLKQLQSKYIILFDMIGKLKSKYNDITYIESFIDSLYLDTIEKEYHFCLECKIRAEKEYKEQKEAEEKQKIEKQKQLQEEYLHNKACEDNIRNILKKNKKESIHITEIDKEYISERLKEYILSDGITDIQKMVEKSTHYNDKIQNIQKVKDKKWHKYIIGMYNYLIHPPNYNINNMMKHIILQELYLDNYQII